MTTLANPLSIMGERSVGRDVRTQNVMAASSIANIVKSSLGPVVRISNLKIRTLQLKMSEILKKNYLKNPEKKIVKLCLHSSYTVQISIQFDNFRRKKIREKNSFFFLRVRVWTRCLSMMLVMLQ